MITAEGLKQANENLKTVNIKGKEYAQVHERIKAFRQLCPEGSITTEVIHLADGEIIMKATVSDEEGKVLGTGFARETQDSSYINKTSYVENCETSAWGRALSAAGLGIDVSIASADEMVNAITNQEQKPKKATTTEKKVFMALCEKYNQDPANIMRQVGCSSLEEMTAEHHGKALIILKEIADSKNGN